MAGGGVIRVDIKNVSGGGGDTGDYLVTLTIPEGGEWKTFNASIQGYDRRLGWEPLAQLAVERLGQTKRDHEAKIARGRALAGERTGR